MKIDISQNSLNSPTFLFALSNAFQNGMTWPSITNDHGWDRLQRKWLDAAQVLPGGDWYYQPQPLSLENFIQIGPSIPVIHDSKTQTHNKSGTSNLLENRLVIPDLNKAGGGGEAYDLRTLWRQSYLSASKF